MEENKRIAQLLNLGFERNHDQECFAYSFEDGGHMYVDYYQVRGWPDSQWNRFYEM